MSIASIASTIPSYKPQIAQRTLRDPDGDGDNDATESAAAKAKEAKTSVNPNLGNTLNITA
jgi:hypothetical protein